MRILMVDDDASVLKASRNLLEIGGYQVEGVNGPEQALESFGRAQFDVVLTDLTMPGMSGWDLARELKKRSPRIPVLLVTGWGHQLDKRKLGEGSVDGVIVKPFLLDEVRAVLDRLGARNAT